MLSLGMKLLGNCLYSSHKISGLIAFTNQKYANTLSTILSCKKNSAWSRFSVHSRLLILPIIHSNLWFLIVKSMQVGANDSTVSALLHLHDDGVYSGKKPAHTQAIGNVMLD